MEESTRTKPNTRAGICSVLKKKLHEKEHNGVTVLGKDAHERQEHHVY